MYYYLLVIILYIVARRAESCMANEQRYICKRAGELSRHVNCKGYS